MNLDDTFIFASVLMKENEVIMCGPEKGRLVVIPRVRVNFEWPLEGPIGLVDQMNKWKLSVILRVSPKA